MSDEPRRLKRRTREHVIADLGMNFVERQILLAGFTAGRATPDYGLDWRMTTFGPGGEVENGTVGIQVKATDHLVTHADGTSFPVKVESADLRYWLFEELPVLLVQYDAAGDRAFWVDVQRYAEEHGIDEDEVGETVTFRIPMAALWPPDAARELRTRKQAALERRGYGE